MRTADDQWRGDPAMRASGVPAAASSGGELLTAAGGNRSSRRYQSRSAAVAILSPPIVVGPGIAGASQSSTLRLSHNTQPAASPRRKPRMVRIRVLIADDHEIVREGLAGLLRDQPDIELVGAAPDGQAAVELARALNPDVVVMDLSMPRLNGIEATRAIVAERPQTRVIGLSMHTKEDMAAAMRQAGAVAYLSKGGPAEDLMATIRKVARS